MPAIQALKTAVTLARTEDTVVKGTTRYDSKYNGLVANAHELVPGLLLAWIASLEKHGVTNVELSDCAVGGGPLWLQSYKVQHAGRWVDSVPQSWGRQCGGASAEFGETVSVVSFVGSESQVPEALQGDSLSQTVTRGPEGKRWSKALLSQVVCVPTEPKLSLVPPVPAQRQVYPTIPTVI